MAGRVNTELDASSRAHTHTRASSSGRLQSSANEAMFEVTSNSSSDGAQGTARGYWPSARWERWPTTDPTCSPKNIGPMAVAHWPSRLPIPPIGSSPSNGSGESWSGSGGVGGAVPRAGTMADRIGRHDSRARTVQSPRPTGIQVSRRPSGDTGIPVASMTLSSATRDSCSRRIRWIGSTLGSASPPVATLRANDRVISHWSGALVPSMFIRSPSSDWNGFPESPVSGGAMGPCYGEEPDPCASPSWSARTTGTVALVVPRSNDRARSVPGGSG